MYNNNNNISTIIANLTHAFRQEIEKLPNPRANQRGTLINKFQVNFMYAQDSMLRGSAPEVESGINTVKKLISDLQKMNY